MSDAAVGSVGAVVSFFSHVYVRVKALWNCNVVGIVGFFQHCFVVGRGEEIVFYQQRDRIVCMLLCLKIRLCRLSDCPFASLERLPIVGKEPLDFGKKTLGEVSGSYALAKLLLYFFFHLIVIFLPHVK